MKRFWMIRLLIIGFITSPVSAEVNEVKGKATAGAWNGAGYFYSEGELGTGDIRLQNPVKITGIAYNADRLTLRAEAGQQIQDGFPTPLRLVLTQRSAPTRERQFGRRIEFTHTHIDTHGRFAYIRHSRISQEQSKDLRRIGEDILAGDVFWIYAYGQQVPLQRRDATPPRQPQSEQSPPDETQILYDMEFTLGWNPIANHKYLWDTREYRDVASPAALVDAHGTEVEINRIACDDADALRLISFEGDLREVLPHTYALKIRKVWRQGTRTLHLRVLTNSEAVDVERFGEGSVLIVPKSIGSWTPEPQSPQRSSYYQTIGGICANTAGVHQNAYLQLVITQTGLRRAPRSPYLRQVTRTWGELKKQ